MRNHELDAIEQVDNQCPGNRNDEDDIGPMLLVGWQYKQGGKRSDKQDRSKLAIPAGLDDDLALFQEEIAPDHHHEFLGENESRNPGWQTAGQGHGQGRRQLENLVDEWVEDTAEIGDLVVMARDVAIQDVSCPDADKKNKRQRVVLRAGTDRPSHEGDGQKAKHRQVIRNRGLKSQFHRGIIAILTEGLKHGHFRYKQHTFS